MAFNVRAVSGDLHLVEMQTSIAPQFLKRICQAIHQLALRLLCQAIHQLALRLLCQAIHQLALRLFKSLCSCFRRAAPSDSKPLSPAGPTAPSSGKGPLNLIAFYKGDEANNNGVTLNQILNWDNERLESVHNYIQWLFPLRIQSGPNPTAPILDYPTIQAFKDDPGLKNQLLTSFRRMLTFYGLELNETTGVISRAQNFAERASVWLLNPSGHHNFLRISRILHSIRLLGLSNQCGPFLNILRDIAGHEGQHSISAQTLNYWESAGAS